MTAVDFPRVGVLPSGPLDAITDVGEIRVGHCTLDAGDIHTGVTVIVPNADPLLSKPLAAQCVFNGFGKSVGLLQIAELGCLETPLALTNTFSVGAISTAQIRAAVAAHPEVGRAWSTVNPLVLECNDGYLNDIQALALNETHYQQALALADRDFTQGSVGAGRGMSCFQLKGGIGSASRLVSCGGQAFTVGSLVLSNFGKAEHCLLAGHPVGACLRERLDQTSSVCPDVRLGAPEKGSIIMILATDAPLDCLQLGRLARRAGNGLARTGSIYGHGSGDLAVAFSTSQHLPQGAEAPVPLLHAPDSWMDGLFMAAAEATEQAIFKALFFAEPFVGRDGHRRSSIQEVLPEWRSIVKGESCVS